MSTTVLAGPTGILRTWPVWRVGALAVLLAAVATEIYGLIARAAGIPMAAAGTGSAKASPITVGMFAMGTVTAAFWGVILAVLLARFAKRPARTFLVSTLVLLGVSFVAPLTAADTATSTKLMLCGGHLLAAAVIIPVVTRRLAELPGRPGVA